MSAANNNSAAEAHTVAPELGAGAAVGVAGVGAEVELLLGAAVVGTAALTEKVAAMMLVCHLSPLSSTRAVHITFAVAAVGATQVKVDVVLAFLVEWVRPALCVHAPLISNPEGMVKDPTSLPPAMHFMLMPL